MQAARRIYLDNAATSWPKPAAVYTAIERAARELGAPAGRGVYREAVEVERLMVEARRRAAELVGVRDARHVIFTANGTDSLNLALHGLLRTGDHVVTSVVEHNSVLRPLRILERHNGVEVTRVGCDGAGCVSPGEIRRAIRSNTRLVALIHVSNVTGAIQPVEEVGRIAAEHGLLYLVDAAQSIGHFPFSLDGMHAHLLAAPGHKGMLGPLGTGLLWLDEGVAEQLRPTRQGGTGSQSGQDDQPDTLPDKFESGNHNVLGIAGLGAGLAWLQQRGLDAIRAHEVSLLTRLVDGLNDCKSVTVYGPADPALRCGVVSISIAGYDPQEAAMLLESAAMIQVRSGLHCAPEIHRALGSFDAGGTIRFSVGPFNTVEDIDMVIQCVSQIAATAAIETGRS